MNAPQPLTPEKNTSSQWKQWISRIRSGIQKRSVIQSSTNELMQSIDDLGAHGGFPAGIPSYAGAFACINKQLPSSNVDKLLHSSRLLKRTRAYTLKHSDHYMEFFTAVEQVVEHASQPLPRELQGFLQQFRQQKLLLEAIEQNNIVHVTEAISHAHPKANNSLALRTAAERGHTQCVEQLIAVSDFKPYNQHIESALELAAQHGHDECVALLVPHAHPSTHTQACRAAARNAHYDIVCNLLPRVEQDKAEEVLASAAWGGNIAIVKMVEQQFGVVGGADALVSASIAGRPPCVEYLVGKVHTDHIVNALKELSKWPDRYGVSWNQVPPHFLEWTPDQKKCAKVLITHCNAQELLNGLQKEFPTAPLNWQALEEQMYETQNAVLREVLEQEIDTSSSLHARRKM